MIFSPRVIKGIWIILDWKQVFRENPDAPSEAAFLAHYAAVNAAPGFAWTNQAKGLAYLYDLTINQAQVTPAIDPHAKRVSEANDHLWRFLPPQLLEEPVDWEKQWFHALHRMDAKSMEFILEQGFNIHNFLQPADWTKTWFVAAGFCKVDLLWLVLNQGFDVNILDQYGVSALDYAVGQYGGSYEAVKFLVEAGIQIGSVDALDELGSKSVTCASEASEQQKIAAYLRSKAAEMTAETGKSVADPSSGERHAAQT